jgi:monoamine oxidase
MGKTPLFRRLNRSLALARAANATGLDAAALVELEHALRAERARTGPSRRDLLRAAAVVGAGAVLGCRRIAPPEPPGEVAVVGAGIAGLACAYRLMQAGVPVRLFEAQKRTGGRIWSSRDQFPQGLVCELGGELIDTNHVHMHRLAAELGIGLDDFDNDDAALAKDVWFFDGERVADAKVVEAFRPVAAAIDAAWETIDGESVTYQAPSGGETIDRTSLAAWLDAVEAEAWFKRLLDVAYTTEYGLEIAEQSAWNLLMMIDTNPEPFRIFGDSDERFHVKGGNDLLPQGLAKALGDKIETGCRLEALARSSDGSYKLSLSQNNSAREVAAERVVLALPFSLLREVRLDLDLPAPKRHAIDELGYGTNAKLMVGFSERLWRTQGGSNGSVLSDLPFQLTWESTRLQPGSAGILVVFTGGKRGLEIGTGTADHHAAAFARDYERIFPGIAERRIGEVRFHWPSFGWTKGSYACYKPGQWTTICGAEGERVGNVHFAGEHTSLDFQGFMEGGLESGERVANELLADLGLPLVPAPAEVEEEEEEKVAGLTRQELLAALA